MIRPAFAATFALSLIACAPAAQSTTRSPAIGFAITPQAAAVAAPQAVQVGEAHVLSSRLNLREPISLGIRGADATITFAVHGQSGTTLVLDPAALSTRGTAPFVYATKGSTEPRPLAKTTVSLRDHRTLTCWTDEATSHVMAQVRGADGTAMGPEMLISPLEIMGSPQAVTTDGVHVVVAFVAVTPEGFDLVASPLAAR